MHPLVRAVAVQLRGEQPEADENAAVSSFVAYMLQRRGAELDQTRPDSSRCARRGPAAGLGGAKLRCYAATRVCSRAAAAGAMLEEDSPLG